MILGITGGIGSGKSTVLHMLEQQYGAKILIADEFGHQALKRGTPSHASILRVFGSDLEDECGDVDRNALADIVYADSRKLRMLNYIIHPYVWECMEKIMSGYEDEPLIVIESAILIEAGYENICDRIWGILSQKETRIQRLMAKRGYSREKAECIMKEQMSEWELRRHCDDVIVNDGDIGYLHEQLDQLMVRNKIKTKEV